jgi:L-ascorbate metabolism protein UlaG (beta-lactamase superfamily)
LIVKRLVWSGFQLKAKNSTLLIDPIYHVDTSFFGQPHETMEPLDQLGVVDAVLITHTHTDHYDPQALLDTFGKKIPIYLPLESVEEATKAGFQNVIGVQTGDHFTVGPFSINATYAIDGRGAPQVSWVVSDGTHRLIHGGDTLWHGYWWKISDQYGPFDLAILPVNGAIIQELGRDPIPEPICLTPEQAVFAAKMLKADQLVPMHYGTLQHPPIFVETPNVLSRLAVAANKHDVGITVLKTNEQVDFQLLNSFS